MVAEISFPHHYLRTSGSTGQLFNESTSRGELHFELEEFAGLEVLVETM